MKNRAREWRKKAEEFDAKASILAEATDQKSAQGGTVAACSIWHLRALCRVLGKSGQRRRADLWDTEVQKAIGF